MKHVATKTLFSQKFLDSFLSEISVADVKLMLGKVPKVSRRYLPPFLSYRENSAGGPESAPQRAAG